ncbi:MAG: response regulator [Gammaproteobacteria bacterium]|nr:response regulator [Gammaproteobacteria bacterium]
MPLSIRCSSSRPIIIGGFASLLALLIALIAVWYYSVDQNKRALADISYRQGEMLLIYQMRDSVRQRAMFLLRMTLVADAPFAMDDQYMAFNRVAEPFLIARDKLLSPGASADVRSMWERIRPNVVQGERAQNRASELILDGQRDLARKLLTDRVLPIQDAVMLELEKMLAQQRRAVIEKLAAAEAANHRTDLLLTLLATTTLVLGVLVAVFVIRRSGNAENQLRSQSGRIRALYNVSAVSGVTLDEQVSEMLRLGCRLTGMETGAVFRLDKSTRAFDVVSTTDALDDTFNNTQGIQLDNRPCMGAFRQERPFALHNCIPKNTAVVPPLCGQCQNRSYIGTSLTVHGKYYGTLNFYSTSPRQKHFSAVDHDLVTLMGNWITVALERMRAQTELAEAMNIAKSANRAKSDFIANMSHEIRTPLTAIIGFSRALMDPGCSGADKYDAAETILHSGEHLHQLINDILDLSKIEAGQLQIEHIAISPVAAVAEAESVVGPQAREKNLGFRTVFEYPLPETIINDPMRLKQILLNLCANATKFTSTGEIVIHTRFDASSRRMIYSVVDTGIGMDEEELGKIFQPFSQADSSTTRRFGGTGLGLWISRQLAQKLGGDIHCESRKSHGSRFIVSLGIGPVEPLVLLDGPPAVSPVEQRHNGNHSAVPSATFSGRILLAEDNPGIQRLIQLIVARTGAELHIVENGQQATEQALRQPFDLIFMDIQMPVMDGIEATEHLRRAGYSGPIVALTAHAMKQDEERCRAAGVDAYLTKPLIVDRFYDTLKRYLPRVTPQQDAVESSAPTPPAEDVVVPRDIPQDLADDPVYLELVGRFVAKLPSQIVLIESALAEKDWEQFQSITHQLKGAGGGFGFPDITTQTGQLNVQCIEGKYALLDAGVQRLAALNYAIQRGWQQQQKG